MNLKRAIVAVLLSFALAGTSFAQTGNTSRGENILTNLHEAITEQIENIRYKRGLKLRRACADIKPQKVENILQFGGVDVDAIPIGNRERQTCLLIVAREWQMPYVDEKTTTRIAKKLIKAGADVNAVNARGETALMWFALNDNLEIVKELIKAGAKVNVVGKSGNTALGYAIIAHSHNTEMVKELIKAGADVNLGESLGTGTALMTACLLERTEIVKELIKAGAKVNAVDRDGGTALMYAMFQRHGREMVKELIKAGADVNAVNKEGETALMFAAKKGPEVVQILLEAGADVNAVNKKGETALIIASHEGVHTKTVQALLEAGADVNAVDKKVKTALMHAAFAGNADMIEKLIKAGSDVHARDIYGQSVWKISRYRSSNRIDEILRVAGAEEK